MYAEPGMKRHPVMRGNSRNQGIKSLWDNTLTWANSVRVLKQTLQQLGGTLGKAFVNLLKPAVQGLTRFFNTLISLVEKAVNAIGKLLGWQIRIDPVGAQFEDDAEGAAGALDDAAGGAGGTAKGLDDAADAAKKLNKQLMAYDEINNIKLPDEDEDTSGSGSPGGGGGGGGASGGGAGEGGAATGGGVTWEKYQSDISSWWELGRKIGETLTKSMEDIDWESIYRKAELFGRGLADFLNGLISPELFSALGATIAGALNTELKFLNTFGSTFNWEGFGHSLGTGLNRFMKEFDFAEAGEGLSIWADGLLTTLIEFLDTVHWDELGNSIGEFIVNIDFAGIAGKLAEAIFKALDAAFDIVAGMFERAPVESSIGFGTAGIAGLVATKLAPASGGKAALAKAITGAIGGMIEFAGVKDAISDLVLAVHNNRGEWDKEWDAYGKALLQLATSVGVGAAAFVTAFGPIGTAFAAVDGFLGLVWGLSEAMDAIQTDALNEKLKSAFVNDDGVSFTETIDAINQSILDMGDDITNTSGKFSEFENSKGIIGDLNDEINEISTALETGYKTAEECVPQLQALYSQLADAVSDKFSVATATLVTVIGDGGLVSRAFEATGNSIEETVQQLQENETEADKAVHEIANTINDLYSQRMENPDLWTDEQQAQLNNAIIELGKYSGTVSDINKSLGELQTAAVTAGYNLSDYFDAETGAFLAGDFAEAISSVVTTGKSVQDTLKTTIDQAAEMADAVNNAELAEALRGEVLTNALGMIGDQVGEKIIPTMDLVQQQLVDRGGEIFQAAQTEWESFAPAIKWNLGYANADEYAYSQLSRYKEDVIDPAAAEIQGAYEQLGVDGKAWASEAMSEIMSGMWETQKGYDSEGFRDESLDTRSLKGKFDELFEELSNEQYADKMSDITKDMIAGGVQGVDENKEDLVSGFTGAYGEVEEGVRDVTGVHSPSRVYESISQDMVAGAVRGITSKKQEFVSAVEKMATEAADAFKKALQDGINTAVGNIKVPKVSVSSSGGMSGVMQGQMSAASSAVDNSMQEMFTDVLPQYFEAGQWDGLFATLSSTLDIGLEGIAGSFDEWMTGFWNEHLTVWFEDSKLKEGIFTPLETNLDDEWTSLTTWFDTSMNKWWDEDLTPWFAADKWEPQFDTINTAADTGFQKVRRTIGDLLDKITDDVKKSCKKMGDDLKDISDSLRDTKDLSNISVTVDAKGARSYATGGFVEDGYFFANHNELVGRFSNGRTAVANNAQIIAGIQAGVYAAVRDAMNDSDGTSVTIVGDTDRIFHVVQNKSRQYKKATGASAFA